MVYLRVKKRSPGFSLASPTLEGVINAEIIGVGSSIVDVIYRVEESFLSKVGLPKGVMTLCDLDTVERIGREVEEDPVLVGGGSIANTLVGLAMAGREVAMLTLVADDELGHFFVEDLAEQGVAAVLPDRTFEGGTGRCVVLVTPDGERTMCTYLGVSRELVDTDVVALPTVHRSQFLVAEAYILDVPQGDAILSAAAVAAHRSGARVVLSLSDALLVGRHRQSLARLLHTGVDIVFANGEEGAALTGRDDPREVVRALMAYGCEGALTLGPHGAIAFDAVELHYSPAREVAHLVDLSGAGDQFVAGYLSGMLRSLPLATCVDLGQLGAAAIIGHEGARPRTDLPALVEEAGLELDRPL